jgi:hypothetical protein
MLNADGTVMTDIFIADNLHMNAKGYKGYGNRSFEELKKKGC